MIQLTMSEDTAKVVSIACEFYARMRMGQYKELIWNMMPGKPDDDWRRRRDEAEELLYEARKRILPELHGIGHSYGMGKFEDADRAFDVYQVLRRQFGDSRTPFTLLDELPLAERVDNSTDWHTEFFEFLATVTAITNGKQQYFEEKDGRIYSRISGEYLTLHEAEHEFLDELQSLVEE